MLKERMDFINDDDDEDEESLHLFEFVQINEMTTIVLIQSSDL